MPEPIGKLVTDYVCDDERCGVAVRPGVTHVRNWGSPDYWLPLLEWHKDLPVHRLGPRYTVAGEERDKFRKLAARRRWRRLADNPERLRRLNEQRRNSYCSARRKRRWDANKDEINERRRLRNKRRGRRE